MKKILNIFLAVSLVAFWSCAKADSEFLHDDNTIHSISISPADDSSIVVEGVIDETTGKIEFPIPKRLQLKFNNINEVKVRATVGFDVMITPSLSGIKDLENEYPIAVEATQTGQVRNYTLRAYLDRK